jgi:hypothetical protein
MTLELPNESRLRNVQYGPIQKFEMNIEENRRLTN